MKSLTKTKKQVGKSPLTDYAKLNALARQIRDGHEATEKFIKSAKDRAQDALREAILTGKALIEVKKILGFGKYGRWLKEHCKGVSDRTCRKYVSLYNAFGQIRNHDSELPITNLRKAYLQLGIIDEPIERPTIQVTSQESKRLTNGAVVSLTVSPAEHEQSYPQIIEVEASTVATDTAVLHDDVRGEIKSSINRLLIDLINKIRDKQLTVDDLQDIASAAIADFEEKYLSHPTNN